jgi:hypothetical protein
MLTQSTFTFYRFTGSNGHRTTEIVRDFNLADGMKGLVEHNPQQIQQVKERVEDWASSKGISLKTKEPFPSSKYPGKVWLEFRITGLTI